MGVSWERVLTGSAIARSEFGACEWNNRIIIAGGNDVAISGYLNDVWESFDGVKWNRLSTGVNSFTACEGCALVVHDKRLYLLGGYDGSYLNHVWMSMDGTKWERVCNGSASFTARDDLAAFSMNGRIYVLGGDNGSGMNDIWSSPDGTTWNRDMTGQIVLERESAGYCVFNRRMQVIRGYNGSTALATVASSPDGVIWQNVSPSGLVADYKSAACVYDAKIVTSGGNTHQTRLYYSDNGEIWKLGQADMGFSVKDHKLVALKSPQRLFSLFGTKTVSQTTTTVQDVWMATGNWQDNY